jgi:sugar phosphate permease
VAKPYLADEYGLTKSDLGWLDGAFSLAYALGQYPGGLLGELFGPRMVIAVAAIAWSTILIGPVFLKNFWLLIFYRLGFGAAQAPAYPNLGKITQTWFPVSSRTSVQGTVASFAGRAGAGLSPIIFATILIGYYEFSWQIALCIVATSGFVLAAVFWSFFRNTPTEHPRSNEAECDLITAGEIPAAEAGKVRFRWTRENKRNLGIFMAASFCSAYADNLFVYWIPQYLKEEKHFSDVAMGFYASFPLWGGAVGGLCGGF